MLCHGEHERCNLHTQIAFDPEVLQIIEQVYTVNWFPIRHVIYNHQTWPSHLALGNRETVKSL